MITNVPNDSNPSFEQLFHHTEQKLMTWLEFADSQQIIIKQLVTQLTNKKIKINEVVIKTLVIDLYTFFPECENCEAGMLGMQHRDSQINQGFRAKLKQAGFILNDLKPLRIVVRATTTKFSDTQTNTLKESQPVILQSLNYSTKWGGALFAKLQSNQSKEATFSSRGHTHNQKKDISSYFGKKMTL